MHLARGMAPPKIQDYAVIGDCVSAALVSKAGGIDWLCWPRFDSPSVFGALLGAEGGTWRIAPVDAVRRVTRRYLPQSNVLETRFETDRGTVVLTDAMAVASEEYKRSHLLSDHEIVRVLTCERGEVDVESFFDPRPDYGRARVALEDRGKLGVRVVTQEGVLFLRSDMPRSGPDVRRSTHSVREGETHHFSLTFATDGPAVVPPVGDMTRAAIERSVAWWRHWASGLRYDGPFREEVVRSALALRLLFYAPSGAIVAAPTTSLPERAGGDLNWDYRFCWLRDASFTVRALFGLGCRQEAESFLSWMLHSTRLTWPRVRILYDVYGKTPKRESELELPGYGGSRPVRIGNAAADQLQLDVYGEIIEAAAHFAEAGGEFDRETQKLLTALGEFVCHNWQRADEGIWEPRSGRRHNTHSRLLCWTALDRLIELHARGLVHHVPKAKLAENRAAIRREIEERAWNESLGSYVATLDGTDVDATLLLLAQHGFEDPGSDRMRRTYRRIVRELSTRGDLLYRYPPQDGGEGAFVICGFWAAEYLAMGGGSLAQAKALFERLCGYANDVGLLAEELDPANGDALGNFPQGFSHVGVINAALTLTARMAREVPRERRARVREVHP